MVSPASPSSIEILEDRVAPAAVSPLFSFRGALHAGVSHTQALHAYMAALSKLVHATPAVHKTAHLISGGSTTNYTYSDGFSISGAVSHVDTGAGGVTVSGGTLSLGGGVVKTGVGTVDLSTVPVYAAGATLNLTGGAVVNTNLSGTATVGYGGAVLGRITSVDPSSSAGSVNSLGGSTTVLTGGSTSLGGSLTISGGFSATLAGAITANVNLANSGSGYLVLTNAGTYSGAIQLDAGTLSAQAAGVLTLGGDATLTPNSDGTFSLAGAATLTLGSGAPHALTVPAGSTITVRVVGDASAVPTLSGGGTLTFGPDQPVHAVNFSLGTGIARIIVGGTSGSLASTTTGASFSGSSTGA